MSNTIKNLFIFASGAAIGSAVTWKLIKTKYEQLAQEQIDSVKEVFSRRECAETNEAVDDVPSKQDVASYAAKVQETGYSGVEDEEDTDGPYVIAPEEFDAIEGYKIINLTYYADEVLAEDGEIIEDIEGTVGSDSLTRFGEYEDDAVHVRNDRLKVDYEILLDKRPFSEAEKHRSY